MVDISFWYRWYKFAIRIENMREKERNKKFIIFQWIEFKSGKTWKFHAIPVSGAIFPHSIGALSVRILLQGRKCRFYGQSIRANHRHQYQCCRQKNVHISVSAHISLHQTAFIPFFIRQNSLGQKQTTIPFLSCQKNISNFSAPNTACPFWRERKSCSRYILFFRRQKHSFQRCKRCPAI